MFRHVLGGLRTVWRRNVHRRPDEARAGPFSPSLSSGVKVSRHGRAFSREAQTAKAARRVHHERRARIWKNAKRISGRANPCSGARRNAWRPGRESNSGARICSPLRHHSATRPPFNAFRGRHRGERGGLTDGHADRNGVLLALDTALAWRADCVTGLARPISSSNRR